MLNKITKTYERKLLPLEAVFVRSPGAIVGIVAKLSGNIDESKFLFAVNKLITYYPILHSKINWDKNDEMWFIESESPIPASIIEMASENDFEKIISSEWKKEFDIENGPLSRFILLKSLNKFHIIFVAHHSITDGAGLLKIIESLLKLINNKRAELQFDYGECLPSIENLNKSVQLNNKNPLKNIAYNSLLKYFDYQWNKGKISLPKEDIVKIQKTYFKAFNYLVILDEFTEKETQLFIHQCKKHNITVNSAIATAILACRDIIDKNNDNHNYLVPVNLRRYLGEKAQNSISCYAGSIDIKYAYDPLKSYWENAEIFNNKFNKALNNNLDIEKIKAISYLPNGLLEASILSQRFQTFPEVFNGFSYYNKLTSKNIASLIAKKSIKESPSFTITNLGAPNILTEFENFKLENIVIYPSYTAYPKASLILSVITLNNKLTFSYHAVENYNDITKKLKEMFKEFILDKIY